MQRHTDFAFGTVEKPAKGASQPMRARAWSWGRSALARLGSAVLLANMVAGHPALAADMPRGGRPAACVTNAGVALLTKVTVRRVRAGGEIAFTFERNRLPRPQLRYVTGPILEDPSGNPIRVAGSRFLEINLQPASGVDLSGPRFRQTYRGPRRIRGPRGTSIREIVRTGDFEAVMTWVVGLNRREPFSVRTSCNPARLFVRIGR